jgi:hypothetical protein
MPTPTTDIQVTLSFCQDEVTLTHNARTVWLHLRDGVVVGAAGQPALPYRKCLVSVPFDTVSLGVDADEGAAISLGAGLVVDAIQPDAPTLLGTKIRKALPDRAAYASTNTLPRQPLRVVGIQRLGGLTVAEILVCPFRYRPASGELELVSTMRLTVRCTLRGAARTKARSLVELQFERRASERLRRLVQNPADVERHLSFDHTISPTDLTLFPVVKHVIVTTAALVPSFQRLADWRSLLGLPSRVVAVEDIVAGAVPDTSSAVFWKPTGYADGATRDTGEAVRNFVKWAAISWATEYVVLGGDTQIVPARQGIQTACSTVNYGTLATPDLSAPAWYAPTASSALAGAPATNVHDDDLTTVWRCAAGDASPWLRLDLSAHTPINTVVLTWAAAHATGYALDATQDGTTWTTIYTTTTAPGGTETLSFTPRSASGLRLRITSGAAFALATVKVHGPQRAGYSGTAYAVDATTTRVYLSRWMTPNPGDLAAGDLVLVLDGAHKGQRIPYDPAASPTHLGWRFVDALVGPASPSATSTSYLEIRGPADWHGQPLLLKGDLNYIATDLYFADVAASEYPTSAQHDWDADANEVYGERYGGEIDRVNALADLCVGRLPATTVAQADVLVDKILRYERYLRHDPALGDVPLPASFGHAVLLGSQNWYDDTTGSLDWSAQGNEDIRHMLLGVSSAFSITRRYEDAADVAAADVGPDLAAASNAAIVAAVGAGPNVVALSSHGSPGYLCYLGSADVDGLSSTPGIWYGNACSTNHFDDPGGPCLGERALLNPNGGGVAYVGNSRFGWTGDNPLELAFWQEMTSSGILGAMIDAAHLAAGEWGKYSLNLLGDPAMRVWSAAAQAPVVTHPAEICTGTQNVTVHVAVGGSPFAGATVSLTIPGVLSATGQTGAGGDAVISVTTSAAATMNVAVSGKNLLPYTGTLKVKVCGGSCGAKIICKPAICGPAISCHSAIGCGLAVACKPKVSCGLPIDCKQLIHCSHAIICHAAVVCHEEILCGTRIACGAEILCRARLGACPPVVAGCLPRVDACTRLRPGEDINPGDIRTIFDLPDVLELARRFETPEVQEKLGRLPAEMRKALELMAQRVRKEENLG